MNNNIGVNNVALELATTQKEDHFGTDWSLTQDYPYENVLPKGNYQQRY